jgi:hypothetical protein
LGKRRRSLIIAFLPVTAIAFALLVWSLANSYGYQMRPVYAVIAAGDQGWGDEASRLLDGVIARTRDRHALAERLLQESDASLVAEGMILAVRSNHPGARTLVQQHLQDHRANWYLSSNADLAKQLLLHLDGKPAEDWVTSQLARELVAASK